MSSYNLPTLSSALRLPKESEADKDQAPYMTGNPRSIQSALKLSNDD